MSYKKILVDNPICSRRFHVTYDDSAEKLPRVQLECKHCGAIVFAEENHPAAKIAREENLVKTTDLSSHLARTCHFKDSFSPEPVEK